MAKLSMIVHNNTSRTLNAPASGGYGISPDAVGGARTDALPYPFAHVTIGPHGGGSDTVTLPVEVEDFRYKAVPWLPMEPSLEWQLLVQKGTVTITFSGAATTVEELATKQSIT